MNHEFEEQKFTAYLLGELDETERREVEEILAESPSARRQLDELRETTALLQEGLQAELLFAPEERLDEGRRARVDRAIAAPGRKPAALSWSLFSTTWVRGLSIAASLVILASLSYWVVNQGISPEKKVQRSARAGDLRVRTKPVNLHRPGRLWTRRRAPDPPRRAELRRDSATPPDPVRRKAETTDELEATIRERASRPAEPMKEAKGREADTRQELPLPQSAQARDLIGMAPGVVPPPPPKAEAPASPTLNMAPQNQAAGRTAAPATVVGQVKDMTGGSAPGAVVKLKSPTGLVQQQTATNETGTFTFSGVPSGRYLVEADMPGFKTTTLGPVALAAGESRNAELILAVGEVAETVTVTGTAPTIQMSSSSLSASVQDRSRSKRLASKPAGAREQRVGSLKAGGSAGLAVPSEGAKADVSRLNPRMRSSTPKATPASSIILLLRLPKTRFRPSQPTSTPLPTRI